jgi:hypothetical protein
MPRRSVLWETGHDRLVRWLWFVVAYVMVALALMWLADLVPVLPSPDLGWSD